jgi:hypothetical protein
MRRVLRNIIALCPTIFQRSKFNSLSRIVSSQWSVNVAKTQDIAQFLNADTAKASFATIA